MSSSDSSRYQPSGSLPLAQCSRPARLLAIITLCLPEAAAQTAPPRPCCRSSPGSQRRAEPEGLHRPPSPPAPQPAGGGAAHAAGPCRPWPWPWPWPSPSEPRPA